MSKMLPVNTICSALVIMIRVLKSFVQNCYNEMQTLLIKTSDRRMSIRQESEWFETYRFKHNIGQQIENIDAFYVS